MAALNLTSYASILKEMYPRLPLRLRQVAQMIEQGKLSEARDLLLDACVEMADLCERNGVNFDRVVWEKPTKPWWREKRDREFAAEAAIEDKYK